MYHTYTTPSNYMNRNFLCFNDHFYLFRASDDKDDFLKAEAWTEDTTKNHYSHWLENAFLFVVQTLHYYMQWDGASLSFNYLRLHPLQASSSALLKLTYLADGRLYLTISRQRRHSHPKRNYSSPFSHCLQKIQEPLKHKRCNDRVFQVNFI